MDQQVFTQRAVKTTVKPPYMQTMWAQGTPAARAQAVAAYTVWAAWCVMWAVVWAFTGPAAFVLTPLSMAALVIPFRPTRAKVRGWVSEPLTPPQRTGQAS